MQICVLLGIKDFVNRGGKRTQHRVKEDLTVNLKYFFI